MKQQNKKELHAKQAAPSSAEEISSEFVRVSKLSESGKADEAWRAANDLYAKYPREATPNFIMALLFAEKKLRRKALPYAQSAVKLAPENAIYKVFLGKLYVDLDMAEFAPDVLHQAFAMDKTQFQAPLWLANYYYKIGQSDRALPYFDLALKAAPSASLLSIRLFRATCLRSLGRVDDADADYQACMDSPQHRVETLVNRALLKKNDQTSIYAKQIELEMDRRGVTDRQRSSLFLSLGRLHENGGDYDNAFLNFDKSRKLLGAKFDMRGFAAKVDDIIRTFTPDVLERFREFGHSSNKPIFIIGMPRSGTTMTEQIIAAHSQAEGVGELTRIQQLALSFAQHGGMKYIIEQMAEMGPRRWKDIPQRYLNLLNVMAPAAQRTVDKMTANFLHVGFIHLCFPNAKIIHSERNPMDCFISTFQNPMAESYSFSYDQVTYGQYYLQYRRLMDHWASVLPNVVHDSRYEKLTASPEAEVRKLLAFLALPWEEACLKFNEREMTVKNFSRLQVRNPINTGSIARWRKYERHLGGLIGVLQNAGIPI